MSLQMHLNKSGSGMAAKTACGRNILRTPMSTNWEGFKATPIARRCEKCNTSKQAEINRKADAKKEPQVDFGAFEPVSPEEQERIIAAECAAIRQGKKVPK
jgi:hypothetical protein